MAPDSGDGLVIGFGVAPCCVVFDFLVGDLVVGCAVDEVFEGDEKPASDFVVAVGALASGPVDGNAGVVGLVAGGGCCGDFERGVWCLGFWCGVEGDAGSSASLCRWWLEWHGRLHWAIPWRGTYRGADC